MVRFLEELFVPVPFVENSSLMLGLYDFVKSAVLFIKFEVFYSKRNSDENYLNHQW